MVTENNNVMSFFSADNSSEVKIGFSGSSIKAGFPSPAEDYMELAIDLNKEIVKRPASTFLGRVNGDSMKDAGINDGDILVIDKSLDPRNGDMAICFVDGEFTVKQVSIKKDSIWLLPANNQYPPIKITPNNDFMIWGIVTYSIKKHLHRM